MPERKNPFRKGDRVRGAPGIKWRAPWTGVVAEEPAGPNKTSVLIDGHLLPTTLDTDFIELVPDESGDASRTVMGQGTV